MIATKHMDGYLSVLIAANLSATDRRITCKNEEMMNISPLKDKFNTSHGFIGFLCFFTNSSLSTKYIPKMIKQRLIKKVQQKIEGEV